MALKRWPSVRHDPLVPTPSELRAASHEAVLTGLPAGKSLSEIETGVGKSNVRGVYCPDVAMFELVIAALDVMGLSPASPLSTEGWRERFLPELTFRNRHSDVNRLVYVFQTAAAIRSGVRPAVLDDTYGWFDAPIWPYATRAAVMSLRAAADGRDLATACAQAAELIQSLEG